MARRTRDFAAPCFALRDGVRRPLALPRDFVDRARRALLVLRALLLPALWAAERRAGLRFFLDAAGFLR